MPQSLSKLYIHLVFSTKGRRELIPKTHINEIHAYVAEILNSNHCPSIIVGGTANHIHILFIQSKTLALSDIVRIVKSNSSKWIRSHQFLKDFDWQDGYGAFSISQSHVDAVKSYIKGQQEHHSHHTFQEEFRRLCQIYGIEIDERYVWD